MKKKYLFLAAMAALGLLICKMVMAAPVPDMSNVKALGLDGALYFADNQDPAYTTLPTSTTVNSKFCIKVPFYNGYSGATAVGSVIIASTTATGTLAAPLIYGTLTTALATTTVLGVSDGVYASGTKGWMIISGYALVQTTGIVNIGDILVTTSTTAGYAGTTTGTEVVGTNIAIAVSTGNFNGGLTTCLIKK